MLELDFQAQFSESIFGLNFRVDSQAKFLGLIVWFDFWAPFSRTLSGFIFSLHFQASFGARFLKSSPKILPKNQAENLILKLSLKIELENRVQKLS